MAIVRTPARSAVAAAAAGMKAPCSGESAGNMFDRINGFRKMMYAITRNVVMPARASAPTVVPRSVSLKKESSPPPSLGARSLRGTSVAVTRGRPPLHGAPRNPPPCWAPAPCADYSERWSVRIGFVTNGCTRGLPAQEQVEEHGQDDADDDHRDDRKVEAAPLALDRDVARQAAEGQS